MNYLHFPHFTLYTSDFPFLTFRRNYCHIAKGFQITAQINKFDPTCVVGCYQWRCPLLPIGEVECSGLGAFGEDGEGYKARKRRMQGKYTVVFLLNFDRLSDCRFS